MRITSRSWLPRSLWGRLSLVLVALGAILLVRAGLSDLGVGTSLLLLGNTFATPSWVMRKVARRLVNRAVFANNCNRGYDDEYSQKGVKMGDTVTGRLPQRYEVTIGAKMNPTPLNDQTFTLTITDQTNIGFEYDSWSATLEVDDYMERYGDPAVDSLVNNIDFTGLQRCTKQVAKFTGTPAVPPGSSGTLPQAANRAYLDAVTLLFDGGAPDPYLAVLPADFHQFLVNGNITLFTNNGQAANFRAGEFANGEQLGIQRWFKSQNTYTHVVGALGGTPLVNGAGQTGPTINVDGSGGVVAGYFQEGDCITFNGCNEINPLSHQSTGRLKQFAVTQTLAADAVGAGQITGGVTIDPALIPTGPFATCSASPADNAPVRTFGHASSFAALSTPQALVYHRDAFALVMADLILPRGLWVAERISNAKLGISIRMLKDHDIINDVSPARLDTAHGWKAIRQELACRVVG